MSHKTKREIEVLLARRFPQADAPQVVRRLPAPQQAASPGHVEPGSVFRNSLEESRPSPNLLSVAVQEASVQRPAIPQGHPVKHPTQGARPRTEAKPLSPGRYKLQVTVSEETHAKLEKAQQLLRHRVPNGDLAGVLDKALDVLLEQELKRQFGVTNKPRATRSKGKSAPEGPRVSKARNSSKAEARRGQRSRHIPNAVRREVLERDELRCSFVSASGQRCSETGSLELHHVTAFGKNGEHSAENIRVFCRAHNLHAAEQDFGRGHMAQFRRDDKTG